MASLPPLSFCCCFRTTWLKSFQVLFKRSCSVILSPPNANYFPTNCPSKAPEKRPLWYYDNKAIRKRKLKQLFRNFEDCHNSKEYSNLTQLLEVFQNYEFSTSDVENIIFKKPRILSLSKEKLEHVLMELYDIGFLPDVINEMVLKCPGLVTIDTSEVSIKERIGYLEELPIFPQLDQQKCLYIIQKEPNILYTNEKDNLINKIINLSHLGFNKQLLYQLVMKLPGILTFKEQSIREKVEYVHKEMGVRLTIFVKFPRVFTCSLDRIRERHEYLMAEHYMKEGTYMNEKKLRAIILPTDKSFVRNITNTTMKDFRRFQESRAKMKVATDVKLTENNDDNDESFHD